MLACFTLVIEELAAEVQECPLQSGACTVEVWGELAVVEARRRGEEEARSLSKIQQPCAVGLECACEMGFNTRQPMSAVSARRHKRRRCLQVRDPEVTLPR